jgi:hypothetical protein
MTAAVVSLVEIAAVTGLVWGIVHVISLRVRPHRFCHWCRGNRPECSFCGGEQLAVRRGARLVARLTGSKRI